MNDSMLEKLLAAKKYRDVCPDTIRRVWDECQRKYKKPRDAEKAAREALHGITGAFLTPAEAKRLAGMIAGYDGSDEQLSQILGMHASTRERLPLAAMDALYGRVFEITGRPASVLDLACGMNPAYLSARLAGSCRIVGVDISGGCTALIDRLPGAAGRCADLLCPGAIPAERFDIALLFKVLPLLERQRTGAAIEVMRAVNAAHLAVSFPTRTLGGRNVGMAAHYSEWMESHLPEGREIAGRFETENELFYILKEI